jgi:uncharacterized protein (DUF2267 family)
MSTTGLDVFDTTVQKTNAWLKDLMQFMDWNDRHKAYLATRATLQALRDRLPVDEVAHLGAQLPMLMRGFYYEGWDPTAKPLKVRNREQFLARIEKQFASETNGNAAGIARGVFRVLSYRVTKGEIEDVRQLLPADLRDLWP